MNTATQKQTGFATLKDAAAYLQLSIHLVREMVNDGRIPHELIGSRRRIRWTAIYKFAGEGN